MLENATAGYGDLRAITGMSVSLQPGKIELILGRNGVGKTTLLSTISGLLPLWEGHLRLSGTDISRMPVYRRAAAGIALVQEGKRVFHQRTVMQNVMLGTVSLDLSREQRRVHCNEILSRFAMLAERREARAGSLSGGQQQMLAIAQALAANPRVLLLDEPSAGLAPTIVSEVFTRVRELRDEGLAILLVEQLASQALAIADHVTVMDNGHAVRSGTPAEFANLRHLREVYFRGEAAPR